MSAMVDFAVQYAADGWRVVPLHEVSEGRCSCPKGADCPTPAKHPRLREWQKIATRDEGTIRGWWSHWPNAGPGLVTGSGRAVLDVDPRHRGDAALAELEGFHRALPRTATVVTGAEGGEGRHFYFAVPDGTRSRDLAPGLELRAEGRLVAAPPAIHESGREYAWLDRRELAEAPEWLLREANARRNGAAPAVGDVIAEGSRNATLTSLAGSMRRRGMDEPEILAALLAANERRCRPPLDEAEVRKVAASVARYEPEAQAEPAPAPQPAGTFSTPGAGGRPKFSPKKLADALRAETPIATGGEALYVYRGGAYRPGGEKDVRHRITGKLGNDWTRSKADDVVAHLRDGSPELWERPPRDRINRGNGILDLADGQLGEHDPAFLSPVQVAATHDPAATCPAVDRFLADTVGDEVAAIFYELAGYLVTPDNALQTAVMLRGSGENGKSTALNLLAALLGRPNVSSVPLHRLDEDRFAGADLYGKLANIAADLDARALHASSTFKAITGGDAVRGERKFRPAFDFVPYARLLFSANAAPPTSDASHAFFRRWLIVPFERRFAPGDAGFDPRIIERLTTPAELSGFLNRGLSALVALHERGRFTATDETERAAERFRLDADSVAAFLVERCVIEPDARVGRPDLYGVYDRWCREANRGALSRQRFNARLEELVPSVAERVVQGTRYWVGVRTLALGEER